jgi:hypothetical protein
MSAWLPRGERSEPIRLGGHDVRFIPTQFETQKGLIFSFV